jgi:hypothetical protein
MGTFFSQTPADANSHPPTPVKRWFRRHREAIVGVACAVVVAVIALCCLEKGIEGYIGNSLAKFVRGLRQYVETGNAWSP